MSIFTVRPQIIPSFTGNPATGGGIAVPALTTWYGRPYSTSIDNVAFNVPLPLGGSLFSMVVRISSAQPADNYCSISLIVNNALTSLAVIIPANAPAGSYFDLVNSVSINPFDAMRYMVLNNSAIGASAQITGIYILLR